MQQRQASQTRLQLAGANILGAGAPDDGSHAQSLPKAGRGLASPAGSCTSSREETLSLAAPPSVTRTGRLYTESTAPKLGIDQVHAENLTALKGVRKHRVKPHFEDIPQAVWSDGCQHLAENLWPSHGIPIFIFCGRDRPRPAYREQFKFVIHDEAYVNFLIRLRCGSGDRHGGGSVGLVHSPSRQEAATGCEGQMVMIIDTIMNNDSSVTVTAVGDLEFQVLRSWIPRSTQGVQMAHVEVAKRTTHLDPILDTCDMEPALARFGSLIRAVPHLAEALSGAGPYTVFVPSTDALSVALDGVTQEELSSKLEALLRCHICPGSVSQPGMYSGRVLKAIDGTAHTLTFGVWPRGDPRLNDVPIEQMDIMCTNGVLHGISGLLRPCPSAGRPNWGR